MSGKHSRGSHLAHTDNAPRVSSGRSPKSPKQKKKGRTAVIVLSVLVGLVLLILLGAFLVFESVYGSMNIQKGDSISLNFSQTELDELLALEEEAPVEGAVTLTQEEADALQQELMDNASRNELFGSSDVYNILLLGNDSRSNNINERTDVMLLVSVNKEAEVIILTSFLRDLYVYIPGYFSHRLNTANALGGPSLTVKTIEQNFGIDIDNYAEVNFYAFVDIIDILGGVDLYLSSAEAQVVGCGYDAGTYHLDGEEALAYCRIRKLDSDFGRTERQRYLLEALWSDMNGISLTDAYSLMDAVLPYVTTNLSQTDCLNLLTLATQIFDYKLYDTSVPADDTYYFTMIDGMSVIRADLDANYYHLMDYIYGE